MIIIINKQINTIIVIIKINKKIAFLYITATKKYLFIITIVNKLKISNKQTKSMSIHNRNEFSWMWRNTIFNTRL
jgi:hypothetical protein